jgi:hypothetical protein
VYRLAEGAFVEEQDAGVYHVRYGRLGLSMCADELCAIAGMLHNARAIIDGESDRAEAVLARVEIGEIQSMGNGFYLVRIFNVMVHGCGRIVTGLTQLYTGAARALGRAATPGCDGPGRQDDDIAEMLRTVAARAFGDER